MSDPLSYDDILRARCRAERQIQLADQAVKDAAKLCSGRLRLAGVPGWILNDLKKELRNFNMHTGEWKD